MVRGEHVYLAIDLKSFYASVECHDRGLDPLRTHLVVADEERTDKTICLAVSPSLKACGIPGRARLFEVRQRLASVNAERAMLAPGGRLSGESCDSQDLEHSPRLKASMVIAKPRMAHYLEVSGRVYGVYLRYAAPEHIHVYSSMPRPICARWAWARTRWRVPSCVTFSRRRASPPRPASAPTCIWRRWRWTSWPSTCPPMRMAFVWRSLTRCHIGDCYGTIVRLRISGGSVAAMPGSLSMPAC